MVLGQYPNTIFFRFNHVLIGTILYNKVTIFQR